MVNWTALVYMSCWLLIMDFSTVMQWRLFQLVHTYLGLYLKIKLKQRFKKERYLIRQDNTIYKFSIKLSFSSTGQDKSKLQKQISKLF